MANYTFLVEDILGATENDSTEFLNYIPKIVNRAEERLTTDLDDYGLVSYTSVAISSGNNIVTLPTGSRMVKNFNMVANGTRIHLLQRTDEYIKDYWPVSASTSVPIYYGRRDNTTVILAPTPVSTYDGQIAYVARPVTLASATPTNYFSDFCYDALFNACMTEALMFMKDYQASQLFEGRYKQSIDDLRNRARRTRRDDMETPASPAGADNPIIMGST